MVLSFCSNWETMDQLSSNLGQFYDLQSELADALIGLYDPVDVPIDSLFDPPPLAPPSNDLFAYVEPAPVSILLPSFSDPSIISLSADIHTQIDEFDVCRCPKRPRSCGDLYQSSELMFEANSHNPSFVAPAMSCWPSVEFAVPPPPPPPPPQPAGEKKTSGGCLSAQSIAARERRKRISEKTQELGRLIPGGNKMNTAEMFQAAFKYVKFLQAQVGILSLMGSMQGGEGSAEVAEDLQVLLKSPTIQEKLSVEEKCIVTKEMLDAMVKDSNIRSTPFISRALNCFAELNESKLRGR